MITALPFMIAESIVHLTDNYVHVVSTISCSLLCFIIGVYIGFQYGGEISVVPEISQLQRLASVNSKSETFIADKARTTVREKPEKSLHSIVHGMPVFCRASNEKFGQYAAEAISSLLSVLKSSAWQHVYSNACSHFWAGHSTLEGNAIMLKGQAFSEYTPHAIVSWMICQDLVTGMEGLFKISDVQAQYITDHHIIIARRVLCKSGSGSIRSSRRELDLVTFINKSDDDSYVIATCSQLEGLLLTSPQSAAEVAGRIKGTVHASGFVLRPSIVNGEAVGTEISFGCHFDMKGARTVRGNTANVSSILSSVLTAISSIQNGEIDGLVLTSVGVSIGSNLDVYSPPMKSIVDAPLLAIEVTNDDFNAIPDADSDQACPSPMTPKKISVLGSILKRIPESPKASSKLALGRRNLSEECDRLALDFDAIFRELSSISRKKEAISLHPPASSDWSRSTNVRTVTAEAPVPTATSEPPLGSVIDPCSSTGFTGTDSDNKEEQGLDIYRDVWLTYGTYFDPSLAKESLNISWQVKVNKDNMKVYSSTVKNSTWCAIKAITVMRAQPMDLLEVLIDANQMGDYDSMFNTFQVSLSNLRLSISCLSVTKCRYAFPL